LRGCSDGRVAAYNAATMDNLATVFDPQAIFDFPDPYVTRYDDVRAVLQDASTPERRAGFSSCTPEGRGVMVGPR